MVFLSSPVIVSAWRVLCELAPWLLLGMVIAGLLHVLLPSGFIRRKFRGPWGVLKAVALGVPLPLCSCGVVPAGIGLKKDGASNGASVGFLISTPQTGVDSILVSASFLGWPFALFKVFSAAVTGMVGGLVTDRVTPPPIVRTDSATDEGRPRDFRAMVDHALEIVRSIWIWLVLGVLASAVIETLVPREFFEAISSHGALPSAMLALLVSLPLYVCATASVPIAAALVSAGLPAGTALVFLMAGPATNIATMGAIYRSFGLRTLTVYLTTIIAGSVGFALTFDWLLSATPQAATAAHHHADSAWWARGAAIFLLGLMVWFAFQDLRRWWQRRSPAQDAGDEIRVRVEGMTCDACTSRLEQELENTEGVRSVEVRLNPGEARVTGDIREPKVREAIRRCGFQPVRSRGLDQAGAPAPR